MVRHPAPESVPLLPTLSTNFRSPRRAPTASRTERYGRWMRSTMLAAGSVLSVGCATVGELGTAGRADVHRPAPIVGVSAPSAPSPISAPASEPPSPRSPDQVAAETAARLDPADDLWQHVRSELRLPTFADRPEVRDAMRAYARDRDIGRVFAGRRQMLMALVINEARSSGVPIELAFLPFVESKLNPSASNAGNVGMWQFQGATARLLGLQTGPGVDERKDPVRATRAAFRYLERLRQAFDGDWLLALTAYNIGDGRLRNLMATSGTRDIWRLPLPPHCRTHMARLAALWQIARNPAAAGVQLPPIADDLRIERVPAAAGSSLASLATRHGVDVDELRLLNAHLGSGVREDTQIWVPRRSGETRREAVAVAALETTAGTQRYQVRPGDSLYALARRFGTTVQALRTTNDLPGDALRIGLELEIPAPAAD